MEEHQRHPVRAYEVVALAVPIAYNRYGDHDRSGVLYTLAEHAAELREVAANWPDPFPDYTKNPELVPKPHRLARPLVLRARKGELLRVRLSNELPRPAGITMQGVRYDARRMDGLAAGRNPDTSTPPGGSRVYQWLCEEEGVFHFGDMADARGEGTQSHGLVGALVVEPEGASWTDPETGEPLAAGLAADVHLPERSFREFVIVMMEYPDNDNPAQPGGHEHHLAADGIDPVAELRPPGNPMLPVNLRIEPLGWRQYRYRKMIESGELDPVRDAQTGEELHHSSWVFGDPDTSVFRAYAGDDTVIRLLHGGMRDTHVFHTHLHQWHVDPEDEDSPIVDSVSISPQQGMTLKLIGGAGSAQRAAGDAVWHCHLYPHFHLGMWGILRSFDTRQCGTGSYPDGTPIAALEPLPHRQSPPLPTPQRPGYPGFLAQAASFPQKPPRPPRTPLMPTGMGRKPTPLEAAAFCPDPQPGEAFTKIGPPGAPVRRYHLVVAGGVLVHAQSPAAESAHGRMWHDHRGMFFVLAEDLAEAGGLAEFQRQLAEGQRTVEPLVIRARKGEVLELTLTNALPTGVQEATAFDQELPFQPECGLHTHLVKFDPLVSDGACIGWNYLSGTTTADQGADAHRRYNSWIYRWYVDQDFGTTLFHDHLLPNYRQRHGLYGVLVAEPEGAVWTHPADADQPLRSGSQAVVSLPGGTAFRELVLAVADFVPTEEHGHHGGSRPINPPATPGGMDEQGVVTVNYRCEPPALRGGDPADWFASEVHGDPRTPILRGYPGEDIRIRVVEGSFDKQHSFTVHGASWREWPGRPDTPLRAQQTLGISTAFNLELEPARSAGDHLWAFAAADDLWLGAWGLLRLHAEPQPDLPALPGASTLEQTHSPEAPTGPGSNPRSFTVRAQASPQWYSEERADPFGLRYLVDGGEEDGPLVLRCRAGEWVSITLVNELSGPPPASEFDPPLLAEDLPGQRVTSGRVSLHPTLLRYDVTEHDGSRIGRNPDSTVKPGAARTYHWYAAEPGVVLLRDFADPLTHMRRGLVGALVIEEPGATPHHPVTGRPAWTGAQAVVRRNGPPVHELVLLAQDGLRLYHDGDLTQPVRDLPSESKDDGGQKAFNLRSAHLRPVRPSLARRTPETPLLCCRTGEQVALHLVVAAARARNHCYTVHGQTWDASERGRGPQVSVAGALGTAATRTLRFTPRFPGDYVYRTTNLHWGLSEGWWGLIRVDGG